MNIQTLSFSNILTFIGIIVSIGIIISLIKNRDNEIRKYKVYSSGDENMIMEYKRQVIRQFERSKRRKFYLGLALLLIGILFVAFQYFQYQNSINSLVLDVRNNIHYCIAYHDHATRFVLSMHFGFILIFSGIGLVLFYMLSKSKDLKQQRFNII
jgi:uncharacterized membrane protein